MKARILKIIPPFLGLLLFTLALWVLHSELHKYHLRDIIQYSHAIPMNSLFRALLLTAMSYFIMTGYDFLALKYVKRPLAYGKISKASFIGYAFSNNIGFSMLAGASVRYRLYSSWGLSALEITKIIFFCTMSIWLGFFTLGSVVFLFEPMALPRVLHLPFQTDYPLGIIFLVPVFTYAFLALRWKKPVNVRGLEFPAPPARFFFPQVGIATLDWAMAGSVLFSLLPQGVSFPSFLGMFMLAQFAGLVSQIPGGIGVFEAVMLLFLTHYFPASIIGPLVVYRAVYYLLPLLIAALFLAAEEILQRRDLFHMGTKALAQWLTFIVPPVLTVLVFMSGVILLFSGATPAVPSRLEWMRDLVPLPLVELSHFLASIVGAGLIILSWGIRRRIDTAYYLTVALLGLGAVLSLLKGLDYEEATILTAMMLVVIPSRTSFYRKGSLLGGTFTLPWFVSIVIVLISTAWLTHFSYKHVEYSSDLWWHFAFMKNAPRSLRAVVGATVAALAYGLAKLFHPHVPKSAVGRTEDIERAVPIIRSSPEASANLALLGDKAFLFNEKGNAFIMYGIEGRSWISMGDPVGPESEKPELAWQFCELCDEYNGMPVFYEVGSGNLHIYIDLGMSVVKLGEEARVNLKDFSLEGRSHKELRHTFNRLTKEGCVFELVQSADVPSIEKDLRGISDSWLASKHTSEKGFSLGSFREDYIRRSPVAVIRKDGRIIAFANLWSTDIKEELSVDLMRYLPDSPGGVMDFLFIHLMMWGRQNGYRWFNLGMAPLSGLEERSLASLWNRIGAFIFGHAEHFYNFQGLRQYKDKFSPEWKPKYLASTATISLPMVLTNVASLVSGGVKGIVAK